MTASVRFVPKKAPEAPNQSYQNVSRARIVGGGTRQNTVTYPVSDIGGGGIHCPDPNLDLRSRTLACYGAPPGCRPVAGWRAAASCRYGARHRIGGGLRPVLAMGLRRGGRWGRRRRSYDPPRRGAGEKSRLDQPSNPINCLHHIPKRNGPNCKFRYFSRKRRQQPNAVISKDAKIVSLECPSFRMSKHGSY
jgi:hypothetical protein